MKRLYALILCAVMWTGSFAQDSGQAMTLEQCVQYALENSAQSKNAQLDELSARARVKEVTGMGLPQINGSASVIHNEKLPRFYSRYSTQPGGFIQFPVIPGAEEGDVVAAPNFFQLKNSGDASVTVNQLIFNGSYFVGLKAAKSLKELASKASSLTREQIVHNVTTAYYNVLINKERTALFDNNISRVDSLLHDTKALFDNGFAESIDVDRVQVSLNNLKTERDKFMNLNQLGIELLKFQMNYPMDKPLDIAGKVEDLQVSTETNNTNWDYKNRPDYQVTEVNKTLQQLNIRNLYAQSLPTLSAFGTAGYSTQSNTLSGVFVTNTNIASTADLGPDKWYHYSMFGLNLSVPLFSGFQQANKIKQQKYELAKIENNQQMLRASIDLEIRTATITFNNALKTLETQKANLTLAENVARVTKIKYEQGLGSNLEVIDAETSLKETQINYYDALFEVVVAKVDLDKAQGTLLPPATTTQK